MDMSERNSTPKNHQGPEETGSDIIQESQITLKDFDIIKVIGRGSYAKVLMVSGEGCGCYAHWGRAVVAMLSGEGCGCYDEWGGLW